MVVYTPGKDLNRIQQWKGQLPRHEPACARDAFLGSDHLFDLWWALPETHQSQRSGKTQPEEFVVAWFDFDLQQWASTSYTVADCARFMTKRSDLTGKEAAAVLLFERTRSLCSKHRSEIALSFQAVVPYG
jgi:hypothetical protein